MCQVCDYIIFRIQQEFDLAMSQLERDKVDTLNSLLADAHIAKWQQKEGIAYQGEEDSQIPDQPPLTRSDLAHFADEWIEGRE